MENWLTSSTVFAREERLALEHLGKDTPRAPDIYRYVVFLPCEHDFWSTVITGGNIARHLRVLDAGETKVTDLDEKREMGDKIQQGLDDTLRSQFSLTRMLLGFWNGESLVNLDE